MTMKIKNLFLDDDALEVLVKTSDGRLVRAVGGSEYKMGWSRSHTVMPGPHCIGYCYYIRKKFAVDATKSWNKFAASVAPSK